MKPTNNDGCVLYLEFASKRAAQNFIDFNEKFKGCEPAYACIGTLKKVHNAWLIADSYGRAVMANLRFEPDCDELKDCDPLL